MKKALILQSWYSKPDENWYPWLKKELQKEGYSVFLPDLPTIRTNLPDMQKQLEFIGDTLTFDEETVVIGHSIGCLLAMRLAEKHRYEKMILVSGWDFNDLTEEHRLFWPNPIDHSAIQSNLSEIHCVGSDNDPYVTAFVTKEMSKRLGGGCTIVKGAGHFQTKDGVEEVPEVQKLIVGR